MQKANGDIAYTRDGNLQVNADGVLTNSQGLPLQPEIDVPAGRLMLLLVRMAR